MTLATVLAVHRTFGYPIVATILIFVLLVGIARR